MVNILAYVDQEAKLRILCRHFYNHLKCNYVNMYNSFLAHTLYKNRLQARFADPLS